MSEQTLKVFEDKGGVDTVIAYSPEDADTVWFEHVGATYEDEAGESAGWVEVDLSKEQRIFIDHDSKYPKTGKVEPRTEWEVVVTAPLSDWVATCGRGFLCSTEW